MARVSAGLSKRHSDLHEQRLSELLLCLYRHPMSSRDLLKLNGTFSQPFPVRYKTYGRGRYTFPESQMLSRLLKLAQAEGLVAQWHFAATRRGGGTPYYQITERGFARLFPPATLGSTLPSRSPFRRNSPKYPFFQSLPPGGNQPHELAVGNYVVQLLRQAQRDQFQVASLHTRHQVELQIPHEYAATHTELQPYLRLKSTTQPTLGNLSLYPDVVQELVRSDGKTFLAYVEIDGGTETILTRTEKRAIEWKVRFYEHHASKALGQPRHRVLFLTYRSGSQRRLHSLRQAACQLLANPERHLFLFCSLDQFLATNGALTRPIFVDHFGQQTACAPLVEPLGSPPARLKHVRSVPGGGHPLACVPSTPDVPIFPFSRRPAT